MKLVQSWADALFLWAERAKGARCVEEIHSPQSLSAQLTGYAVSGYEISLYCQTKQYLCRHLAWWVPNRVFTTYHVFSVVSSDAPQSLREACALDVPLPAMSPRYVSRKLQKKLALNAYLDLLIERLRQQNLSMKKP